jgi:ribosomal protein S18 acetylase RimI-like enzyme
MGFRIEKANINDYIPMAELIQKVWDQVENKAWFAADNAEYTYNALQEGNGIGYKAIDTDTGKLAAIFLVTIPGKSKENLGYDIGLPEEEMEYVASMDSIAVLAEYRGHGLQYKMMQNAEAELKDLGFRYLMCTIHPDNKFSRDNVLKQGYKVAATKEKYGGYLRDVLVKTLL